MLKLLTATVYFDRHVHDCHLCNSNIPHVVLLQWIDVLQMLRNGLLTLCHFQVPQDLVSKSWIHRRLPLDIFVIVFAQLFECIVTSWLYCVC